LSILLHLSLFVISSKKKEITLGDKLIPVEVLDISSIISKGDYIIKPEKRTKKLNPRNLKKEKFIDEKILDKILKEDNTNEILEVKKTKKEKKVAPNIYDPKNNRIFGNEGENITNQVEKGSLKGKGTEKITCLACVKPEYPKIALRGGYEGIVKLKIWIATNGEVIEAKIIKSSGYEILDKAGIKAALKSKFYPVSQKRTINIEYNLKLNRR
jgi:TonB family protein